MSRQEHATRHHREHIAQLRRQIEARRQDGGYDASALRWAAWYLDQAEALLAEANFAYVHEGVFLAYLEQVTKHLVWAREPVRDAEARRNHNRRAAKPGQLRSEHKRRAIAHYLATDPQPESREAWERMLDVAGIPYPETGTGKWYTQARKLWGANRK